MRIRSRIGALLVAGVLGVGAAIAVATPAFAEDYGPFHIVQQSSNLCIEDSSHAGTQGAQLRLNVCSSSWLDDWQFFTFTDAQQGPYTYIIRPSSHLNLCLQAGAPSLYGSTIILWPCWAQPSVPQIWFLGGTIYPWFYIQNVNGTNTHWVFSSDNPAVVGGYVRQKSVNEPNRDFKLQSLP